MNLQINNNFGFTYQSMNKSNKNLENIKNDLQEQMQALIEDKKMDGKTKNNKIKSLQDKMDNVIEELGKQYFKDLEDQASKIIEKSIENSEKKAQTSQDTSDAEVKLKYSLISAASNGNTLKSLSYYRNKIISEEGINSDKVKRIDSFISSAIKNINRNIKLANKVAKAYAENEHRVNKRNVNKDENLESSSKEKNKVDPKSQSNNTNFIKEFDEIG